MSAKKHVLVPRNFTAADVDPCKFSLRDDAKPFHHMTAGEAMRLAETGRIVPLGSSGKVWQIAEEPLIRDGQFAQGAHRVTTGGRISLAISSNLQSFMSTEMSPRPSWAMDW